MFGEKQDDTRGGFYHYFVCGRNTGMGMKSMRVKNLIEVVFFILVVFGGSYLKTLIGSIIGSTAGLYVFIECDQKGLPSSALVIGPTMGSILVLIYPEGRENRLERPLSIMIRVD